MPPFIRPLFLGKNPFAEPEIFPVCQAKELFYENSLYPVFNSQNIKLLHPGEMKMKTWQLQEAKIHLSEVVRKAISDGPQNSTLHGKPAAVVVSYAAYLTSIIHEGYQNRNFQSKIEVIATVAR